MLMQGMLLKYEFHLHPPKKDKEGKFGKKRSCSGGWGEKAKRK